MSGFSGPELTVLVAQLRARGLVLDDDATGRLAAPPRGAGPPALIDFREDLLRRYVLDVAASDECWSDDPRDDARGIVATLVLDHLTADHGGGANYVSRLALVDDGTGPRLVEERTDDPEPRPATGDGPHDDRAVFGPELDSLARTLRAQGLDAVADTVHATIRVGPSGRAAGAVDVVVELAPHLYRAHLERREAEYEAIGGDPRAHAWTAWCRLVTSLLVRSGPELRRLSFVRDDTGEVGLAPNADDTTPSAPRYAWTAERPSSRRSVDGGGPEPDPTTTSD